MANILIIQSGNPAETLIVSSLLHKFDGQSVTWITDKRGASLLSFNNVFTVLPNEFVSNNSYDILINFSPQHSRLAANTHAAIKMGYSHDGIRCFAPHETSRHYQTFILKHHTDCNQFQICYALAGQAWRGEGYSLKYFPKTKSNRRKTGIAVQNDDLRNTLLSRLSLQQSQLCELKMVQDPLQQIDEINKCKNIITDNEFILHATVALRKHVEFLTATPLMYRLESFGNGNVHIIKKEQYK